MQPNNFFSLEQAIDRQPLVVAPQTPLPQVISLMQEWANSCSFVLGENLATEDISNTDNSCALIVENSQLKGIFTERDLVKLVATEANINLAVEEVMSRDVIILTLTGAEDVFTALDLLRRHGIRHLPVVDHTQSLLGLITAKSLRQKLQPINLMQWRKVGEIMTTEVVWAAPDDSVRQVAKLMAAHQVSCVAIVESESDHKANTSIVRPIGIITERDIVQFQNLSLNLAQPAHKLMSTPLFLVSPEDTLWELYQRMQQLRVRRLLVEGSQGELRGIVTQSSLLQVFDPAEMYGVIEILQRQVCQLENDQTQLLENRQQELEQEVAAQTADLQAANQRLQLESSLRQQGEERFDSILNSLEDVVYSADPDTLKLLYINSAVEQVYGREIAEFYDNAHLWLEVVHPEDRDRTRLFTQQVIAIGGGEIEYRIVRPDGEIRWLSDRAHVTYSDRGSPLRFDGIVTDVTERRQAETLLRESQERFAVAVEGSSSGLWDWNILTNEVFYAPRFKAMIGYSDAEMPNVFTAWSSKLHPEDRAKVLTAVQNHLEQRIPYDIEYRLQTKQGEYIWFNARGQAIWDEHGRAIRMAGSITDISDRQRREKILKDIASGMSVEIGENFLPSLVKYLSQTLRVDRAYVGTLIEPERNKIKTQAVCSRGQIIDNYEYDLIGTPCQKVVEQHLCVYPEGVQQLFPESLVLREIKAESFAGMPIVDTTGRAIGLIAIVNSQPFDDVALIEEVLTIFVTRVTTELERQQAESDLKQSEQKFRAIFDWTFQFTGLLEPNGDVIEANRTALEFVGLTPADVRGKPFWSTPWWSMSQETQELLQQAIAQAATGEFVRFEVQHPGTENRLVTVDFSLTPIEDETGKVVLLIPEGRNISSLKQVEADLQQSNRILQAISSIQTQFLTDTEPQMLFDGILENLLELTASEYGFIGEILFAADGSPMMEESYMKFRGRPYLKTHAITNIAWNEETREFYAENAPKGMEFHNLETLFGAVIVTGETVIANSPSTDPRRGGLPDGHPPLNAFLGVPFYKNNKMIGMVGLANREGGYDEALVHYLQPLLDTCSRIIEAFQSERQKQQAEEKNREQAALLNVATDAIMVRGLDDRIQFWNRGAQQIYGWTEAEALGQNASELLYGEPLSNIEQLWRSLEEQGQWQGELKQVTKAGREIIVESRWTLVKETGNPRSVLVVNTDITEQKQLQAQFLRTQRLESLGTLAGGIAHDLNNILAPILGFSRLLPLKLPNVDEQTKGFFKIMENNAQRGTALVKQILTFARGLEGERGIVQVRHLIVEIEQIILETFPKSIELQIHAPKNLWTVQGDVNQLHQVLMNLAVNARDAMPEGGKLRIAAENIAIEREYAKLHLDAKVGNYVLITVTDTGIGIASEIVERIFEPFFTTKEIGRGTGLGLSTVLGIIKSHGGFVEVTSERKLTKRGTQFQVFLPAEELGATSLEETTELPQGNGELILVVDDETAMIEVTKATLETYNYQVLTASNGIEAIALYVQHQQAINLVIIDIMMPLMDGRTAIRTLKQINPAVKILAVSGLVTSQDLTELDRKIKMMAKPYSNEDLLRTIRDLIGETTAD
ncbi:PAS domain S-box protein [Pleurocapsales cyanobacterium LEGE 10410]|nr:PAS domain S-box protein [Pleurocapsales cyanobacterium LEGE 10410]